MLDVFFWGLKTSPVAWTSFLIFGHKNPGTEPFFVNLLWSSRIDSQPGVLVRLLYLTWYCPARLLRRAESIPWNRFLGSLNVYKFRLWGLIICSAWNWFFTLLLINCSSKAEICSSLLSASSGYFTLKLLHLTSLIFPVSEDALIDTWQQTYPKYLATSHDLIHL